MSCHAMSSHAGPCPYCCEAWGSIVRCMEYLVGIGYYTIEVVKTDIDITGTGTGSRERQSPSHFPMDRSSSFLTLLSLPFTISSRPCAQARQ
jgi:hypothetical protein